MDNEQLRLQALEQKKLAEQQRGLVEQLFEALKAVREDDHFEENLYKAMIQR